MRAATPCVNALLVGAAVAVTGSCTLREPPPSSAPAAAAFEQADGVVLGAELDRAEMRTVDRLTVRVTATAPAGVTLGELSAEVTPPWTEVSWLVASPEPTGPRGTVLRGTLVVETRSPGTHAALAASIVYSFDGQTRTLRTDGPTVIVESVLAETDDGTLEPARGLADAPLDDEPSRWPQVGVIGVGVAVLASVIALLAASRRRTGTAPDDRRRSFDELRALSALPHCGPDELARAEAATRTLLLHALGPRSAAITARELRTAGAASAATAADLLARFEELRYAGGSQAATKELVADALAACIIEADDGGGE